MIQQADALLKPGGHLFCHDLVNATAFAGGDTIRPPRLFDGFEIVRHPRVKESHFVLLRERFGMLPLCYQKTIRFGNTG